MTFIAKLCPVCQYGSVSFWRCANREKILLLCDECDSIWIDPSRIDTDNLLSSTASDNYIPEIDCTIIGDKAGSATIEDIEKKGWEEFILEEFVEDEHQLSNQLKQKPKPFTISEYKNHVHNYRRIQTGNIQGFLKQIDLLEKEYFSHLPTFLLGRCPICKGRVYESIDTYSLNGQGWSGIKSGAGWRSGSKPSYEAECEHLEIVSLMVNLNGIQPNDITQEVWIGSERPFVMPPILNLDKTFAVIHTIPIGRYDDMELQSYYTAYFVSYFTDIDKAVFDKVMQPAYEAYSRILYEWADYDLIKWVRRGKLYWLNGDDQSLYNQPTIDFPYSDVKGGEGIWVIRNGQMELKYGKNRQWSGGELEPEWDTSGGFLRQLVSAFKSGIRNRKK